MKKAIASISKNSDFVISFFFVTLLITLICYNIVVHGIAHNTVFEF